MPDLQKPSPPNPAQLLQQGLAFHQRGQLAQAQNIYEKILSSDPDNFGALHLLGKLEIQAGRNAKAIHLLERAIALRPTSADACNSHGNALKALKHLADAVTSYDKAIALESGNAGFHYNRGNALLELKRFDGAVASYDKAIALKRDFVEAHNNRGTALLELKQFDAAIGSYDKAIALRPDWPSAYNNRGNALLALKQAASALASLDKAIAVKPDYAEAHNNRGNALFDLRQFDSAIASFDRAIALKPDYAIAYNNRANALLELKRVDDALVSYDKAVALKPDYADALTNKAQAQLLAGDFADGWRTYEWRKLKKSPSGNRFSGRPLWLGTEDISGKRLLVHGEQGLGDTIQFCRYIRVLLTRGAKVLFAPQKSLASLMRPMTDCCEIVDVDDNRLQFDFHCPLLSLPLALGTDLESIPASVPYLRAEEDRVETWQKTIGTNGFRIGVCWQGSTGKGDTGRSFPASEFMGLSKIPDVRLISLYKGESPPSIESLGESFDAGPDAFLDTAATMLCCDLVITSDTAVAHLAGALGVPVWVVLKYVPNWRWLLDREDSPWYPTMRLFRQKTPGDWKGVFAAIEAALVERLTPAQLATPIIPVSWGELIDKITILEIKDAEIVDANARANVAKELALLRSVAQAGEPVLKQFKAELLKLNATLWSVEDELRVREKAETFDAEFVELARSVYRLNDLRASLKRNINNAVSSELVEEKLYR